MTFDCRRPARILAVTAALVGAASVAQAAQCRGTKVVQNCVQYHADGTWYVSNLSVPPAYTTCQPIQVPCDYPDNIFDAISKIFQPPG